MATDGRLLFRSVFIFSVFFFFLPGPQAIEAGDHGDDQLKDAEDQAGHAYAGRHGLMSD